METLPSDPAIGSAAAGLLNLRPLGISDTAKSLVSLFGREAVYPGPSAGFTVNSLIRSCVISNRGRSSQRRGSASTVIKGSASRLGAVLTTRTYPDFAPADLPMIRLNVFPGVTASTRVPVAL